MSHRSDLVDKDLTREVIGGFFTVYNALGYGFWEIVYANALASELGDRGLRVEREVLTQVYYKDRPVAQFRVDMLVERRLLIENKSCAKVGDVERRQLLNYLRATKYPLALLLHFGPTPAFHRFILTAHGLSV